MLNKISSLVLGILLFACNGETSEKMTHSPQDFNFGWEFQLQAQNSDINTPTEWRPVNLPHDWSIEQSASEDFEGNTAYLPGGVGVYKKNFTLELDDNSLAYVIFDGIYNNSEISINGKLLESHPYGYAPFYLDISEAVHKDGTMNTIEVKVDRTRYADSRWYSGSGIYRKVSLLVKNKLHIPVWGTFVTTPKIDEQQATVSVNIDLENKFDSSEDILLETALFDKNGDRLVSTSNEVSIGGGKSKVIQQLLKLDDPMLWELENPYQYRSVTTIRAKGVVLDSVSTKFGVRSIRFDADEGFFLNGKNKKIKGVCLHHDGGLVGAAVPEGVWRRRLQKLKDGGCNAIRISHNPGSQEFLNLCDEMGFLVQDEFFDEWDNPKDKRLNMNEKNVDFITMGYTEHFQEWAEIDLKNTVLAHRNHPSIIQWSIGNEIEWTYPRNGDATGFFNNMNWSGNYFWEAPPNSREQIKEQLKILPKGKYDIGETAQKLATWAKELDTTRYVTANSILPSSSYESGYIDALDIVGFSYRRILYDYGHENYPEKPLMGTENLAQWHEWKAVLERPFVPGIFLWTGIDYLGESNGGWPKKGTKSGLLDLAGFEKPSYHMFKSLWTDEPHLYIATHNNNASIYKIDASGNPIEKNKGDWKKALWEWHDVNEHWNYGDKENIIVEVYSNCEEVELFLNKKSVGTKKLSEFEDYIYKWSVPFEKGTLLAKGKKNDKFIEIELETAGEVAKIELTSDSTTLRADGYDVAHIVAQLVDSNNNPVKTTNRNISFTVEGDAKILGVDTGSVNNVQDYRANSILTDMGRCLLIVQSKRNASDITISASSEAAKSESIKIKIQ